MKINRLLSILFAFVLLFNISCSNDEEYIVPAITYENGIFITNEGNFGKPNADVTFVTRDLSLKQDNIFASNNGSNLGDVLQMITFKGENAFLVLNNSNKVKVVNRFTFKNVGDITEQIDQPRYMAFTNNNIYVTNDKYNGAKYVSVYNATTLSFVKKIPFTDTVERVVEAGGNIFVQNASYGFGNKITYINTTTNDIQSVITLPNGNINKTISNNSNVYVIAGGTTDSYIYQISNTGSITKTITLTGIPNANNIEIEGNKFYFTSGNKVYTMNMSGTAIPTTPLFTATGTDPYSVLYGFSVIDGKIFTSDANGFTEDSKITVYSTSGSVLKTFTAGKASNGFYLN